MTIPTRFLTAAMLCLCFTPALVRAQSAPQERPRMSVEATRNLLEAYWAEHDPNFVAEDAVFTMMPTGQEIRGREAIAEHLHHFYNVALNARAERRAAFFGEGEGVLEADVVGHHTGEFAGIAATHRQVRVPLAVTYELENDQITRARIYLMVNVLVDQLTRPAGEAQSAGE